MQKRIVLLIAAFLLLTQAHTQVPDFETYRRQQQQALREFAAERDSTIKAMQQDFASYVEERNKEFASYLRGEWEPRPTINANAQRVDPKLDEMPAFSPTQNERSKEREKPSIRATPPPNEFSNPELFYVEPITIKPVEPAAPSVPSITANFYGRDFSVAADPSFRGIRATGITEKDVADWYERVSQTSFTPTLVSLLDIAEKTGMSDWALYMLTQKTASRLASNHEPTAQLYTWFILIQAGYDIRIGRQHQKLIHMLPFTHIVYSTPRLVVSDRTYYLLGAVAGDPFYTYTENLPGAFRFFEMNFNKSPIFAEKPAEKTLSFTWKNQKYSIRLQYDPVLVAMLAEQPQAHMDVYLNADGSNYLFHASQKVFEPLLEPMSDVEKVSFLLYLTQNAFEYKTDTEQFGFQKYMVPDEVFHYTHSDCDDRAVLFGWLVRNFAGQKVAALLYPGHLANAVHFHSGNPPGDFVEIDGLPFVVADPTYINAPIGLTMPDFRDVSPTAWVIDSRKYLYDHQIAAWETLHEYGARRGSNQNDMVMQRSGTLVATGYFTDVLRSPQSRIRLENFGERRTAFVGYFGRNLQPIWLQAFTSNRDATGISVMTGSNGVVYMAGTFTGAIGIQGRIVRAEANQTDVFVAAFEAGGQLIWLRNAGLNSAQPGNALSYAFQISRNGENISVKYFNDPRESVAGLVSDGEHGVILFGSIGSTTGLVVEDAPISASGATVNYSELLVQKNRELISMGRYETTIAGLFAAIQLSKSEGVVIPGSAAQDAIRRANPRFATQFPETFENIGKISFLRNKSGIIEIRTDNGRDVFFDKMRIRNGSTIRVRSLGNGDEQIDILSNIHVGQMIVWYPLNFIRLNHRTGDLLFDYRSNNSQVTLNLKNDILN